MEAVRGSFGTSTVIATAANVSCPNNIRTPIVMALGTNPYRVPTGFRWRILRVQVLLTANNAGGVTSGGTVSWGLGSNAGNPRPFMTDQWTFSTGTLTQSNGEIVKGGISAVNKISNRGQTVDQVYALPVDVEFVPDAGNNGNDQITVIVWPQLTGTGVPSVLAFYYVEVIQVPL